jgi:hypothetical protein
MEHPRVRPEPTPVRRLAIAHRLVSAVAFAVALLVQVAHAQPAMGTRSFDELTMAERRTFCASLGPFRDGPLFAALQQPVVEHDALVAGIGVHVARLDQLRSRLNEMDGADRAFYSALSAALFDIVTLSAAFTIGAPAALLVSTGLVFIDLGTAVYYGTGRAEEVLRPTFELTGQAVLAGAGGHPFARTLQLSYTVGRALETGSAAMDARALRRALDDARGELLALQDEAAAAQARISYINRIRRDIDALVLGPCDAYL